ncbi:MAG: zf-HC2 domain-containing protein [Anaerolineae bacterium]|nr:zf-HC2 domain-containing protein [Anaerolineae bacterium]
MFKWTRRDSNRQSHIASELLSAYIDNEVTAQERKEVAAHLATCASCREDLQSLRNAVVLVRALPRMAVPRAFTLTEAMVGAQPRRARSPWIVTYLRGATVVAAMMLVVLVGGDLFLRSAPQTPQMIALQSPAAERISEQPLEKVVQETVVVASSAAPEEARAAESEQPAAALAAVPEATQPVQQKAVRKAVSEPEKATERTVVEKPENAETASPIPAPVTEIPRGGGSPGGVGGIGGAGGPGGGEGGGSDEGGGTGFSPGEPVPTEAPPQPDETRPAESAKETVTIADSSAKPAQPVEATPAVKEKTVEKVITPTPQIEKAVVATPEPTAPAVAPSETPAEVALAQGEQTSESVATHPVVQPKQTQSAAPQPFAWQTPLRVAEISLGVLIALLLAATWIAARRP